MIHCLKFAVGIILKRLINVIKAQFRRTYMYTEKNSSNLTSSFLLNTLSFSSMVEAIVNMEQLCDFPILGRLASYCRLDTRVTQVRLWPQHDARHPSVMVEVRKSHKSLQLRPRWYTWLLERLQPSRYQVDISASLQDDVLARIAARDTVAVDPDKVNVPHDYKVLFDEIIRRLKILEVSHLH